MKEWTEIYEQMRGTFAQRAGFVPSEGCDSAVRLYALAAELQSLLMQADWVLDQSFPQTAQGMYLDYHAETRGITRAAAEKAVGVVQCTNPTAFSGGCDAESDEALRGRVLASYQRLPNGANAAYYEQEAMRYPGVAAAKAVGRARGIGTVNVVIATHAGVPDAALLAAVETDLQKKREIAVDVKVLAPAVETVAVTAALKAAPGYTFAEVKAGAQSALEALFTGELLGKSVTTARLLTLLCGVEGVENVHLTAPAADVAVGSTELPMLGTVTLSELTEA